VTYFSSKVRAMIPAAIGAAELVPPNEVVHAPSVVVVLWSKTLTYMHVCTEAY